MFHRQRQKAIQQAGMAIFPCAAGLCSYPDMFVVALLGLLNNKAIAPESVPPPIFGCGEKVAMFDKYRAIYMQWCCLAPFDMYLFKTIFHISNRRGRR